jgi:hypothetical protein
MGMVKDAGRCRAGPAPWCRFRTPRSGCASIGSASSDRPQMSGDCAAGRHPGVLARKPSLCARGHFVTVGRALDDRSLLLQMVTRMSRSLVTECP